MYSSTSNDPLVNAVRSAMDHPGIAAAIHALYARLQTEIDQRKPICVASGKCCHFDAYGHRLYVTTAELAVFLADRQSAPPPSIQPPTVLRVLSDGCPLQQNGLCSVHPIRPFGCRIFFCDPTATDWQQQQYARFHAELKQMHDEFNLQYFYVEWRAALAAMNAA